MYCQPIASKVLAAGERPKYEKFETFMAERNTEGDYQPPDEA